MEKHTGQATTDRVAAPSEGRPDERGKRGVSIDSETGWTGPAAPSSARADRRSHEDAAFHYETAAHHHRQASRHHAAGRHDDAHRHSQAAAEHARAADDFARLARGSRPSLGNHLQEDRAGASVASDAAVHPDRAAGSSPAPDQVGASTVDPAAATNHATEAGTSESTGEKAPPHATEAGTAADGSKDGSKSGS